MQAVVTFEVERRGEGGVEQVEPDGLFELVEGNSEGEGGQGASVGQS